MASTYGWDASSQELVLNQGQPGELRITWDDLTSGRLSVIGGTIRDSLTGRIIGNLPSSGDVSVVDLGGGAMVYANSVDPKMVNRRLYPVGAEGAPNRGGYYAISGTADIAAPDGSLYQLEIRLSAVGPIGTRLAVKLDGGEITQFVHLASPQLPEGFRWATADEAMSLALEGYIARNFRYQVNQLVAAQVQDENGQDIANQSDAIAYLARMAMDQVTTASVNLLAVA